MRLNYVHAQNFLSIEDVRLDLDGRHTFLVGPNGGGKTNFVRALTFAVEAIASLVGYKTFPLSYWTQYVRVSRAPRPATPKPRVRLGVTFTGDFERQLITDFVRHSLYTGFVKATSDPFRSSQELGWISEQVTCDAVAPLFDGVITTSGPVEWGRAVSLAYSFDEGGQTYELGLSAEGLAQPNQLIRVPDTGSLSSNRLARERVKFSDSESAQFSFSDLLPPQREGTTISVEGISPSVAPQALRSFATDIGVPPNEAIENRTFSFAWVLNRLFQDNLVLTENIRQAPRRTCTKQKFVQSN